MQIWISKESEVPLREQLTTQIMLGIASQELPPNQKLPSTRELARRFHVHSNTVNAAYRDLAKRGWVEFRKGSGVYVRPRTTDVALEGSLALDPLIAAFLKIARSKGFSLQQIQERVRHWLALQPPDHFLVIEPDVELRRLLMAEIAQATGFPVAGVAPAECRNPARLAGAAPVAIYGQADEARAVLPLDTTLTLLRTRSAQEVLRELKPLPSQIMIAVISHWPEFLRWARAVLEAAGVDPHSLSFRDARQAGWQAGLRSGSTMIITDSIVGRQLPAGCRQRVFRLIADSSLSELKGFVEQFLGKSSAPQCSS